MSTSLCVDPYNLFRAGFFVGVFAGVLMIYVSVFSGPSVPPVWCVSTGRTERIPAGTALPALLLQRMLGAALHCFGQRRHRSG